MLKVALKISSEPVLILFDFIKEAIDLQVDI